jgi:NAD dependent epimerase/dehydratase family enzyme
VTVLTRSPDAARALPRGAGHCLGDPSRPGPWQAEAAQHRFVVNLAGASIFGRWTRPYKELILSSRADVTRNLAEALSGFSGEPPVLVSASAVGYYGFHGDEELDESSPPGDDFLARVCRRWEDEARRAEAFGARVVQVVGIVDRLEGGAELLAEKGLSLQALFTINDIRSRGH